MAEHNLAETTMSLTWVLYGVYPYPTRTYFFGRVPYYEFLI